MEEGKKTKRDPILDEFKFCETCEDHVLKLIEYIRNLENVQVVAKDALETINLANAKLTKDVEYLQDELAKTREALEGKERDMVKGKMVEIDKKFQRFVSRGRL